MSRSSSGRDVGQCQVTVSPTMDTAEGLASISAAGKIGSLVLLSVSAYLSLNLRCGEVRCGGCGVTNHPT